MADKKYDHRSVAILIFILLIPITLYGMSIYRNIQKSNREKAIQISNNTPLIYETDEFKVTFPCGDISVLQIPDMQYDKVEDYKDFSSKSYSCDKRYIDENKSYKDWAYDGRYQVTVSEYYTSEYGTAESNAKKCEDIVATSREESNYKRIHREVRAAEGRGIYYICALKSTESEYVKLRASRYINNKQYDISLGSYNEDIFSRFETFFNSFIVKI